MTLEQLIAQFRTDSDDLQAGNLSSNDSITLWLNEAQEEAAIRAQLIHESTDPDICVIPIVAGTSVYALHSKVLDITRADFTPTGSTTPINLILRDRIEQDRLRPDWRTTTDVPQELIQNDTSIRLGCTPNGDGSLSIECYRLPLAAMAADPATPEIAQVHHRHLVQWALHRCYSRPDAEIHDPKRAELALYAFTQYFGIRPDADLRRSFSQNRPMFNKAW
jgi:hypothetical protein